MIRVIIIGAGNVAFHLTEALLNLPEVEVKQVYNRNIEKIRYLENKTSITNNIAQIMDADLFIIAISDDQIEAFSRHLETKNGLVVHTSGSVPMAVLKAKNKGVFYPLQSFSKAKKVSFKNIPFCLEASTEAHYNLLFSIASKLSERCYPINSSQRKSLHVAAVFVNNFTNHMYTIGNTICENNAVPFEILHPLIHETTAKIMTIAPKDAQTGPARRNDEKTMQAHLDLLANNQKTVYKTISHSIIKTYE